MPHAVRFVARRSLVAASVAVSMVIAGCDSAPTTTPPITPGTSGQPRAVNIVARDDVFSPPIVDLVPGETVILHMINGGLAPHEVVIGGQSVQDAWEIAEANAPPVGPGATPTVSVLPELGGLRLTLRSGERVDQIWTVPADPSTVAQLIVGCHVPGHYAKGMHVPVRVAALPAPGG